MSLTPVIGNTFVCIGYTTQLSNAMPNGVWSSDDTAVATVDAATGEVTGVGYGTTSINYVLDGEGVGLDITTVPVQISNGFNLARVLPALMGRIGWMQPTRAGSLKLDSRNLSATAGRYWSEGHELVTVNNLYNTQEDDKITAYDFNNYLQAIDRGATMRVLNAIFTEPTFIEKRLCYLRNAYQQNVLIPKTQNGAFCGYRFVISPGDFAVQFNAITLFFNNAGTFNIYLFNDLLLPPMKTKSVTTVANSQVKVELNWVVNYVDQYHNGGIVYIGYFDNDLPSDMQAIDEQLNQWQRPMTWGATPFTSARIGNELNFNRRYVGTVFYSYGLNCEVSAYRDYTQTIVQNAHLFDEVRMLTYAIQALGIIKSSVRTNKDSNILDGKTADLNLDMNLAMPTRDFPFVAGLKAQLERALKNLSDAFKPKREAKSFPIGGMTGAPIYDQYQGFDINNLPARQTLT